MRVLVFEPHFGGHRLHYVASLVPALTRAGAEVSIALRQIAPSLDEFQVHLAPMLAGEQARRIHVDAWIPNTGETFLEIARLQVEWLRENIRRTRPDHVFVPGADGLSQLLGLSGLPLVGRLVGRSADLGSVETEALMLRGPFAYPQTGLRPRLAAELSWAAALRAPWTTLYHLDPLVVDAVRRRGGPAAGRLRLMPEAVEPLAARPKAEVLAGYGFPPGRYVGSAGLIDHRKGIDLLLRAFRAAVEAGRLGADDRLLLAGRHAPEINAILREREFAPLVASQRIVSVDRVLATHELVDFLGAMDLVCTPYPRHIGSASIVVRAAAVGRPVLGSTWGWIRHVVPRFGLGWMVDVNDPSAFAEALPTALDESAHYRMSDAGRRFVEYHTVRNFQAHWARRLLERMGLPADSDYRTWEWALGVSEDAREAPAA